VHSKRAQNGRVNLTPHHDLAEHVVTSFSDPQLEGDDCSRDQQGAYRDDLVATE
jgi:hypothetical protein